MRVWMVAVLLGMSVAGCLDDSRTLPVDAAFAGHEWAELGAMLYEPDHEHNIRDLHEEVARGVEVLDFGTLSEDGRSLGEYTEIDLQRNIIAVATVIGENGADLRISLLDADALPELILLGEFDVPGAYGDVKIDPELDLVYVAAPGADAGGVNTLTSEAYGFHIFDISDPANAVPVGGGIGPGCHMLNTLRIDGTSYVWCATFTGAQGYRIVETPSGYVGMPVGPANFQSDPEVLAQAEYYAELSPLAPALVTINHDQTAQIDPLTGDPILVSAHELNGIRIFDISTPEVPIEISHWRGAGMDAPMHRMHTAAVYEIGERRIGFGATETLWDAPPEVYIVDFTDYAEPVFLERWTPPGIPDDGGAAYSMHNFQVVGTRLYVANFHAGTWVLDVSDPADPVPIALRTPVYDTSYPWPEQPLMGSVPMDMDWIWDVVVADGYVLHSDGAAGIEVFHVKGDPAGDASYRGLA